MMLGSELICLGLYFFYTIFKPLKTYFSFYQNKNERDSANFFDFSNLKQFPNRLIILKQKKLNDSFI
jgi:hypothetical protein